MPMQLLSQSQWWSGLERRESTVGVNAPVAHPAVEGAHGFDCVAGGAKFEAEVLAAH